MSQTDRPGICVPHPTSEAAAMRRVARAIRVGNLAATIMFGQFAMCADPRTAYLTCFDVADLLRFRFAAPAWSLISQRAVGLPDCWPTGQPSVRWATIHSSGCVNSTPFERSPRVADAAPYRNTPNRKNAGPVFRRRQRRMADKETLRYAAASFSEQKEGEVPIWNSKSEGARTTASTGIRVPLARFAEPLWHSGGWTALGVGRTKTS
jgi:hypothetical protein